MARQFFYYGSIRSSIIKFLSIFDDMQIAKFNADGSVDTYIDVPIKFMPKKKWYSWMYERSHSKRYPMIGVELTSIEFAQDRKTGEFEDIKITTGDSEISYTTNPIPYNLGFTVSIATEYISEQDQISEQLLPWFSPYVYTKVNIDEIDVSWDMKVTFNSASIEAETEIAEDDTRSVIWRHDYTVNTFLLKPASSIDLVKKVVSKFYLSDGSWDNRTTSEMPSGEGYEQEELLVIGSREDDAIMARYLVFD